ncbi:Hypothetical protein NTJ_08743 [Nesidiocoris tenuis]|uniref:Cyclic nucleotide-binding domain-containing protein n=2 Tax=Nesidiocoris tenuis TaxID=355587 RepID=A0ABN7AUS4_9HEMI|nr:Hypothetical protein NTJ_08743 [Nesidiocoris tenuis]
MPYVVYAFVLLTGWAVGYFSPSHLTLDWRNAFMDDALIMNCLPIIYFNATYKIDYHTLMNSLWLILLVSIPLLFYHYAIMILITYSVLNDRLDWTFTVITLFSIGTGPIHVDHCVSELNKVQGQMRVLQLVLLGERLVSFAVGSFMRSKIKKYHNPNFPHQYESFPMLSAIGWTVLSICAAILAAHVYKFSMRYFYKNNDAQATMAIFFMYLLFWATNFLKGNGGISVLVFGISVGYMKIKYSSSSERFFSKFWDLANFIATSLIFATVGFYLGATPHRRKLSLGGLVFLIYIIVVVARGLGFMTVYPIVKRFGLQITLKHFVIATIGVSRSPLAVAFAYLDRTFSHGYTLVLICTIVYLASTFFNIVLLQKYLDFFGMYKMSHSRLVNMNVAMAQVNESREKVIRSLKMDRLIADSNWLLVDSITRLSHPYRYILDDHIVDLSIKGLKTSRTLRCIECTTENDIPPTALELEDMILEAKQRILKAQLVCFAKQHENGTLTRQGFTILNDLVEGATVKEDPILSFKDLRIQRQGTRTLKFLKLIFGNLFTITSVTHRYIPTNFIRATCFRICSLRSYNTVMACLSLVDLVILVYAIQLYYRGGDQSSSVSIVIQTFDISFFTIFLIDFMINVLGIGVVQYFSKHVNNVEFALGLLIRANQIAMYLHTCYVKKRIVNVFTASAVIFVQKTLMLARISRIYVFIVALIPKVMVLIDKKLDQDLIRWYDIGKAYMISLNRVAYFLNHISDNEVVHHALLTAVEKDRELITRELGLIQKDRETIAISNKTLHAIRHVIISMGDCISSMKDEGLLDPTENRSLQTSVEKVKRRLLNFSLVPPCSPESLLHQVSWLFDDNETCSFFLKHARLSSYNEFEKIIYYGDDAVGLYVIVSGMVRVNFISSDRSVTELKTHGIIPNCDYFTNLNFSKNQIELAVSGNLLGEYGVVTGRRYDMDVVCETRVQLYYIPWQILKTVIHDSGNAAFLQAKIWKSIGVRMAIHLLHTTSRFRGWQDNKILMYLQRGIVPSLDCVESLHLSEFVDDVILIEGKVMDQATRTVFTAPVCIPRLSSQKLILPGTSHWDTRNAVTPKLLLIPNQEAEMDDIMSNEGLFKYAYQENMDKRKAIECASHSSPGYASRMIKAQRRRKRMVRYMDFMPAILGPVEMQPVSTTYIDKMNRSKSVKAGSNPRTRVLQGTTTYTQDITEQSEAELMRDDDEEEISTGKRSSSRQKSSIRRKVERRKKSSRGYSLSSERDSSYYQYSSAMRDGSRRVEIVVIEEPLDDDDLRNTKTAQTDIQMKPKAESPAPAVEASTTFMSATLSETSLRPGRSSVKPVPKET